VEDRALKISSQAGALAARYSSGLECQNKVGIGKEHSRSESRKKNVPKGGYRQEVSRKTVEGVLRPQGGAGYDDEREVCWGARSSSEGKEEGVCGGT